MIAPLSFFTEHFNLTVSDIENLLSTALSKGGDYADLYFEYSVSSNLNLEEQIIKSANRSVTQGVGVRVVAGERTGYAYCDEIDRDAIRRAALTAAHIASSEASPGPVNVSSAHPQHNLYPVTRQLSDESLERRIELLQRAEKAARSYDPRIREVQSIFVDKHKIVLIATSDGLLIGDVQPLVRMNVSCIADDDGNLQRGYAGGGGRDNLDISTRCERRNFLRLNRPARPSRCLRPSKLPPARWKWCLVPAGPACCCTKPSVTALNRISIARALRPLPG